MRTLLALAMLALPSAISAQVQEKPLDGDLAKLQGHWKAAIGPSKNILVAMTIQGTTAEIRLTGPDGQEITIQGEFQIDEKASPKAWNWRKRTLSTGQELPESQGIYKVEGDTLTICNSRGGTPRPTEFKEEEGAVMLVAYTRSKSEK